MRPRRKITARSYSRRILMPLMRMIAAMTTNVPTRPSSCPISSNMVVFSLANQTIQVVQSRRSLASTTLFGLTHIATLLSGATQLTLTDSLTATELLIFVKYSDIFWDCMLMLDAWEI